MSVFTFDDNCGVVTPYLTYLELSRLEAVQKSVRSELLSGCAWDTCMRQTLPNFVINGDVIRSLGVTNLKDAIRTLRTVAIPSSTPPPVVLESSKQLRDVVVALQAESKNISTSDDVAQVLVGRVCFRRARHDTSDY